MRRLRFEVAYDGTDFHGWQVQPGLRTIQGVLEEIISGMDGRPVHVAGSGRTDAGVHALAQVAAVSIENPIPVDNFRRAVNRLLPSTIRISNVRQAVSDFPSARFDAVRKTYEYRIFREEICSFVCALPFCLSPSVSAERSRPCCEAAPLLESASMTSPRLQRRTTVMPRATATCAPFSTPHMERAKADLAEVYANHRFRLL